MAEVARITIVVDAGAGTDPPAPASDGDLDRCRHALQEEQARNHALAVELGNAQNTVQAQNDLLRTRTIERDHYKEDSYLWGLVVAWAADKIGEGELAIRTDDLREWHGRAIEGKEEDGWTTITVGDRLPPSPEGA